jgi:predicted DNA-binding protein
MKRMSIKFTDEQHELLKEESEKTANPISTIIRRLVVEHYKKI